MARKGGKASDARELAKRLAYPSDRALIDLLNGGGILDCPITAKDVRDALRTLGPDLNALRGKFAPRGSMFIRDVAVDHMHEPQELHADVMGFQKRDYLVVKWKPANLVSTKLLDSRDGTYAIISFEESIRLGAAYGWKIREVIVDPERALKFMVGKLSVPVRLVGTGAYVVVAEREIRTLKDRCVAIMAGTEYQLPPALIPKLVEYATIMLNLVPRSGMSVSSRELVMGIKLNYKRDLRSYFGEVVMLRNESGRHTFRSELAIALWPEFTERGSWLFWGVISRRELSGESWVSVPVSEEIRLLIREGPKLDMKHVGATMVGSEANSEGDVSQDAEPSNRHFTEDDGISYNEKGGEVEDGGDGRSENGRENMNEGKDREGGGWKDDVMEVEGDGQGEDGEEVEPIGDIDNNITNLGTVIVDGVRKSMRMRKPRVFVIKKCI